MVLLKRYHKFGYLHREKNQNSVYVYRMNPTGVKKLEYLLKNQQEVKKTDKDEKTKKALKKTLIYEGINEAKANDLIEKIDKLAKLTGKGFFNFLSDYSKVLESCVNIAKKYKDKNITYKEIMMLILEIGIRLVEKGKI